MALRSDAWQRQGTAVQSKGYEVNCCAVALRSTDRQGKGGAEHGDAKEWQRKALM
jgi:hypothetical protein